MSGIIDTFNKIFSAYSLLLVVCTLIFNPLILYICLKSKRLRSNSTFKLLTVGAINDILVCLSWNQDCFSDGFFNLELYYKNLFYCRTMSVFLQFTTFQIESWLIVSISLDRFLSLTIKKWSKNYFVGKRPYMYAIALALLIIALNFNEVFLSGYSINVNGTEEVICFTTPPESLIDWYFIMTQVHIYFGYITPYVLLVLSNSLIIYKATRFERVHSLEKGASELRSSKRKAEMTRTILFITFLYIIITFPNIIITGYLLFSILALDYGSMLLTILSSIQFSYPALHFFILFFSNRLFAEEVKSFFYMGRRNSISTTHTLTKPKTDQI